MQTRHYIIATLILILGLAWTGTASAGPLKKRIKNQDYRIHQGIANGDLTYREARHLRRHQRKILRLRHHFLSDGHLTHRERQILRKRLNRNSERIYALRHNRYYY